jgi:hypothetical protein
MRDYVRRSYFPESRGPVMAYFVTTLLSVLNAVIPPANDFFYLSGPVSFSLRVSGT